MKKTWFWLSTISSHRLYYIHPFLCQIISLRQTDRFLRILPVLNLNLAFFLTLILGKIPLSDIHLKISLLSEAPSANSLPTVIVLLSVFIIFFTNSGNALLS